MERKNMCKVSMKINRFIVQMLVQIYPIPDSGIL